jgi:tetratricopeptide (TPR) repeat protein
MLRILALVITTALVLMACSREAPPPSTMSSASDAAQDSTQGSTREVVAAPVDEMSAVIERAQAPLLDGMGDFNHPITTADPWAQRYFNQGMIMAAGFNHAESVRAFKAAQRLDPNCAMCFWGEALATGPNINVTSKGKAVMMPDDRLAAFAAIQQAIALSNEVTQRERDLIAAQSRRYNGDVESDRTVLDAAYAQAMRELASQYPDDDDIQAMFAEALMNTMPWNYWLDGENPRPETAEVINALETVMARNERHPLALHLYIHAVEASSDPGRAEDAADKLADMVPGSGHLVHMPSHIYWRIGRYYDASEANVRAAKVDEDYIAQCNAQGFYPALYYPHNIHFLWASASMEGRSAVAIEAGRKVAANVRLEQIKEFPTVEFFQTVPLLSLVRFAHWEEILQEPQPPAELAFSNAIWHYARAIALARTGALDAAEQELTAMQPLMDNESVWFLDGNDYPASQILTIAQNLVLGELAQAREDYPAAIAAFSSAVEAQDVLPYTEPPFWYYPTRQSLGHALLKSGDYSGAEAVYRADLAQYPRNGWSLFGLSLSLEAQGKTEAAQKVKQRFDNIWGRADVELKSSVL